MRHALRRWRTPLLVALCACTYPHARRVAISCSPHVVGSRPHDGVRVISWNLRNFPGDHDQQRLREQLDELDPQVLALQEVLDPSALPPLRPGWRWHASRGGGRHDQHLVIGWDPTAVLVHAPLDHDDLTMDGRVRPALSAHIQRLDGAASFHLVVVHLKATRHGHALRRQQWPRLRAAVDARQAVGPDDDLLIVGDFNVAGGPHTTPAQEEQALRAELQRAGLHPWPNPSGCSAYWDGVRRDAWWEPSHLDLVFGRGFAQLPALSRRARIGTHCARHACTPFRASAHHPDPDFHGVSDHCPVVIDLPPSPGA